MSRSKISIAAFLAAAAVAGAASAQPAAPAPGAPPAAPALGPTTIKEVKPGLFMVVGNGGNVTVRVGDDELIMVDTKNPGAPVFAALMDQIKTVTSHPIKYVFITHVHADHSGNTGLAEAAGATVIADDGEKALLAKSPAANRPADPSVTFDKTYAVKLKGAAATAYHFAPGHTGGDALVFFPDEHVLSSGDEVSQVPNIDYPNGGSALGLVKSLAEADKLDFDTVIPGHGEEPLTRAQFEAYRKKWDTLVERARALVKAGVAKQDLLSKLKLDDLWPINNPQWNNPARVDAFYAEMSK